MTCRSDFSGLTPSQRERLSLLIEECAEVIQASTKILRHGYESWNPTSEFPVRNRQDLSRELGDLLAAIELLSESGDFVTLDMYQAKDRKRKNVGRYLHHQSDEERFA